MNYYEFSQAKTNTVFPAPKELSLKLLTYNLFLRPPGIKTNFSDYKDDRLDDFIVLMNQYDIICLQEVFATLSSRKERLIKKAIKYGFYFIESSPDPSFFSRYLIDGGLVILSRFPINASEFFFFQHSDFPDSFTYRGAIYVKIDILGQTLHLFTGHTQATYVGEEERIKKNIVTRTEQIYELSHFVKDCLEKYNFQENHVALFLADFNVDAKGERHPLDYISAFSKPELVSFDGGYFNEYETLMRILSCNNKYKVLDLLRNNYCGLSPPTYGVSIESENGQLIAAETVLTAEIDLNTNHCLDYFLQFVPNKEEKLLIHSIENEIYVDQKTVQIEKFLVKGKNYTQLSDHFGVSGVLKVMTKKNDEIISFEVSK